MDLATSVPLVLQVGLPTVLVLSFAAWWVRVERPAEHARRDAERAEHREALAREQAANRTHVEQILKMHHEAMGAERTYRASTLDREREHEIALHKMHVDAQAGMALELRGVRDRVHDGTQKLTIAIDELDRARADLERRGD